MDGVIFDTVDQKASAFLSVFRDRSPEERTEIDRYNRSNLGIPRADKMRHIAAEILGANDVDVAKWLETYANAIASCTNPPPLIAGAKELFCDRQIDVFVCSSAPPHEIVANLSIYGLENEAKGVFGFPTSKTEALISLKKLYGSRLCFVGDADADRDAARNARVRFILRSGATLSHSHSVAETVVFDLRDYKLWAFSNV